MSQAFTSYIKLPKPAQLALATSISACFALATIILNLAKLLHSSINIYKQLLSRTLPTRGFTKGTRDFSTTFSITSTANGCGTRQLWADGLRVAWGNLATFTFPIDTRNTAFHSLPHQNHRFFTHVSRFLGWHNLIRIEVWKQSLMTMLAKKKHMSTLQRCQWYEKLEGQGTPGNYFKVFVPG